MINLPDYWQPVILDDDDELFLINSIGRFKTYSSMDGYLLFIDEKLNYSWGVDTRIFNTRQEYEQEIKNLEKLIIKYYENIKSQQLEINI